MPPFLRLLPLPRRLTSDLPSPIAAGIGLAVSLPATAARLAVSLPHRAIGTGVALASRYAELASLGTAVIRGRSERTSRDDDADPFPAYDLDTSAWGAADAEAEIVRLFDDAGTGKPAEIRPAALREPSTLAAPARRRTRPEQDEPAATETAETAGSSDTPATDALPMQELLETESAGADDTNPEQEAADAVLDAANAAQPEAPPTAKPTAKPAAEPTAESAAGAASGGEADSAPPSPAAQAGSGGHDAAGTPSPEPPAEDAPGVPAALSTGLEAQFLVAAAADRAGTPATSPRPAALPVDGYDGLSAAALRARVSSLSKADLTVLRDYEAGHARRVTVLQLLERAIAKA